MIFAAVVALTGNTDLNGEIAETVLGIHPPIQHGACCLVKVREQWHRLSPLDSSWYSIVIKTVDLIPRLDP